MLSFVIPSISVAQNFWKQLSGPTSGTGGKIFVIATNPSGHIFAGTYGGAIYRSTDNGESWTSLNIPSTIYPVASIGLKSNGYIFSGVSGVGIARSTNNGASWTWVNTGLGNLYASSFAFSSGGMVFAGTGGGVFRSSDDGATWSAANSGLTNLAVSSLAIGGNGYLFAATNAGVFRSTDGANSWTQVGLASYSLESAAINSSGHVFAGAGGSGGVFRSTDNGNSWTSMSLPVGASGYSSLGINFVGDVFAGCRGCGVSRSTDNGQNWAETTGGLTDNYIYVLAINSNGYVFAGTSIGMFRSVQSTIPVAPPQNLTATPLNGKVLLRWNKNTEANFLRYRIHRSTAPNPTAKVDSTTGGINDTTRTITGLVNGTTYYFRLTAVDAAGNVSDYSNNAGATPNIVSICVSRTGSDVNVGAPSAPLRNIQTALSRAGYGDTVKVAAGTYNENLAPFTQVILKGGYGDSFEEGSRDFIVRRSTIGSGGSAIITDNQGSTIDGFLIDGTNVPSNYNAIEITGGYATLTHSILTKVHNSGCIVIRISSGAGALIKNNTLVDNVLSGGGVSVSGIYIASGADPSTLVRNNIITTTGYGLSNYVSSSIADYNCINYVGYNYSGTYNTPGPHDINTSPKLVYPAGADYRLKGGSPCIDGGDPSDPVGNEPVPNGGRIDMGAFGGTVNATRSGWNPVTCVSNNGSDANSGSAASPYQTIQYALTHAMGDTIKVATGTYTEGLITTSPGYLRGGYSESFSEASRNIHQYRTTVQAVSTTMWYDDYGVDVDGFFFNGMLTVANYALELHKPALISHNVIMDVKTTSAYAVRCIASVNLVNNVFYNNYYAIYLQDTPAASSVIKNNIAANNNYAIFNGAGNGLTSYNCYYNNAYGNYSPGAPYTAPGIGEITLNPQFRNASGGDFRLQGTSPCINTGDPSSQYNDPDGSRNDMGVFYYDISSTAPSAPTLSSPSNGSTAQPTTMTLSWSGSTGATKYHVQVSSSSAFASFVVNDSSLTGTSRSVGSLANGTTYYWRVRSGNSAGWSAFSGSWSFTTSVTAPSAPVLASPASGTTGVSSSPTLTWNASGGATSYRLQVSTVSTFSILLVDQSGITGTSYGLTGLTAGTVYYWRVNATNAGGTSGWSAWWTVTTAPTPRLVGEYASDANTVLLLHMNETSGTTLADASSYGNNGAATGTAIASGMFGKARSFNGWSDYLLVPAASSLSMTSYTIEAWVNCSYASSLRRIVVQKGPVGSYELAIGDSSTGLTIVSTGAVSVSGSGRTKLNPNVWHHIAATFDFAQGMLKLYLDGMEEDRVKPGLMPGMQDGPVSIGANSAGTFGFYNGMIDEVRISNIARSPGEFNLQLPPVNLTAAASGTSINVSWQNGGGAVGLLRYKLYRGVDSTNVSLVDSTTSLFYSNAGLTSGTRYFYRVSAVDSAGFEGAKSYAASVTTGAASQDYYVDAANGSNASGNGSQANPWKTITYALNQISGAGLTLHVAAGTYNTGLGESFPIVIKNGVSLSGAGIDVAVLDAQGTNTVIKAVGIADPTTLMRGLTIEGAGNTNQGGGLLITAGSALTVDRCRIADNTVSSQTAARRYGGGIYILNSSPIISNCEISGNVVMATRAPTDPADFGAYGGGIAITGTSSPQILQNTIQGNEAQNSFFALAFGAGIYVAGSATPRIEGNTITGNTLHRLYATSGITLGAGIYIENSNGVVTGNTIADNGMAADYGSLTTSSGLYVVGASSKPRLTRNVVARNADHGIWCAQSSAPTIVNNTIAENGTDGVYLSSATPDSIVNNIFALNSNYGIEESDASSDAGKVSYNLFYANSSGLYRDEATTDYFSASLLNAGVAECKNNLDGDPAFLDLANGDYHLRSGSLAINAGDPGTARDPDGSRADIGAFYYQLGALATPTLSSPANGATAQPTTLSLSWASATGASKYHLQVSADPAFTTFIVNDSSLAGTSKAVGPLSNGTTFYWRVRAGNSSGWSSFSGTWNFTTVVTTPSAPSAPALTSPADGASGVPTSPALGWGVSTGATSYRLQVSTSSTFPATVLDDSALTTTSRQVGPLSYNTVYYWRVSASNTAGTSSYSTARSFTTIIQAPDIVSLTSPADGATNQSISLALGWSPAARATSYRLQLSASSTFASVIVDDSTLASTSYQTPSLANGTVYYWHVSAKNAGGVSAWSSVRSFTTVVSLPSAPTLITPLDNDVNVSVSPTLNWNAVSGAASYRLQVSTVSDFATTVFDQSGLTSTSKTVTSLANGTKHYWRVSATNTAGTGSYSSTRNFTTIALAPAAPVLSSPASGSSNQPTTVTLSWIASIGATTYRLQVSTSATFTSTIVNDSTLTTTSKQVGPLSFGTTYYWRVSASSAAGTGAFSSTFSFTTIPSPPTTLTLSTSVVFPTKSKATDYLATDYRLIGIPGSSSLALSSLLNGTKGIDWQAYWDNGSASNYLVEFDGSSAFQLSVGRAFWVITKGTVSVNRQVTAPTLNSSYEAEIPLNAGWNLITNPFGSTILWSKVQAASNNTNASIYGFTGSFATSTTFDPYVGYYFYNGSPNTTLSVLKVPYVGIFTKLQDAPEVMPGEWRVNVALTSGDITDGDTWFGVSLQANVNLDPLDQRKPRGVSSLTAAYFERPDWDPDQPAFATDVRPNIGNVQQWNFTTTNEPSKFSSLVFRGVAGIPSGYEVYLVDPVRARYADLRADSVYFFMPVTATSRFSVLVGGKELVLHKAAEVLPAQFFLSRNFPNPFNPSTSFSVDVPVASLITLKIYNTLGQEVRSLLAGLLQPGRHWFQWDGRNEERNGVPSGAYYCRMTNSEGKSQVTRMLLVK